MGNSIACVSLFVSTVTVAVIDVAAQIGVARLYALCHPEHRPSQRVLEKCGFVHDVSTRLVEFPNLSAAVPQEALCYALALKADGTDHAG